VRGTLASVWQEHRIIVCLALGYITIGGLVLTALGRHWPIAVFNRPFAIAWSSMTAAWLLWRYFRGPRQLRQAVSGPRLVGAILASALVVPTQITFQALKQSIGPVIGFRADPLLHRVDVLLHGGMAWTWFEPLLMRPSWVRAIDFLYMAWFGLLFVFFFWASWSGARVLRQRALIAFLLMWIGGGTATAWLASSAGPCYYEHVVAGADPYAPLLARLDAIGSEHGELKARFNQRGLWEIRRADTWGHFAGISAMPSLHVGVAVLLAVVAMQRSRVLGSILTAYAAVIQIGSVILAWHYAVDGYLGALLAVLCWKAAGALVQDSSVASTSRNGAYLQDTPASSPQLFATRTTPST
jgi:hypothetical protein